MSTAVFYGELDSFTGNRIHSIWIHAGIEVMAKDGKSLIQCLYMYKVGMIIPARLPVLDSVGWNDYQWLLLLGAKIICGMLCHNTFIRENCQK